MNTREPFSPRRTTLLALLAVAAAGCLGEGPFDVDEGDFTAKMSGGLAEELRGLAQFNLVQSGGPADGYFIIRLFDLTGGVGELDIIFYRALAGIPGANEFPLQPIGSFDPPPEEFAGVLMAYESNVVTGALPASAGTLSLESTAPTEVHGSFHLTADGPWPADPEQEVSVSVQGSFRAVHAPIVFPTFQD